MALYQGKAIDTLLPHAGNMRLLDSVLQVTESEIICRSRSHRRPDNPLVKDDRLRCAALVEYAAQAAAIHASLAGAGIGDQRVALIGAVKSLQLNCRDVPGDCEQLQINARAALQGRDGAVYEFSVEGSGQPLATGRLVLLVPDGTGGV